MILMRRTAVLLGVLLVAVLLIPVAPAAAVGPGGCGDGREPGTRLRDITVRGTHREYWLTVPPGYTGDDAVPLVMDFHGQGIPGVAHAVASRMRQQAGMRGWVVVTAHAPDGNWLQPRDRFYVDAVLADVHRRLCIDPDRRFADGISMGAGMSVHLTCYGRRTFAAIAPVAGVNVAPPCVEDVPTAIFAVHGTADHNVPYGVSPWYPSVRATMARWAVRNGCTSGPFAVEVVPTVTRLGYGGCLAPVRWLRVLGGTHSWPGGASLPDNPSSMAIDATARILHFFASV